MEIKIIIELFIVCKEKIVKVCKDVGIMVEEFICVLKEYERIILIELDFIEKV